MVSETQIHPEKVQAYLAAEYRIGDALGDIILKIGQHSRGVAELFARNYMTSGAFLTAFNPHGTLQSDAANELAHKQLADRIYSLGLHAIEGVGSDEKGDWPAEKSYFALGLDLATAKVIGTHFDQDAIVWVGADATPQLIRLR